MTQTTLVLVFKRPAPGQGKQRIAAKIGERPALALAEALLACALEDAFAWPGPVVLSPADGTDRHWTARLGNGGAQVVPQETGNLGERLQKLDVILRRQGCDKLLYIGSDAPMMTAEHLASADTQLERHDVALCRADDGGVILMGARRPWPALAGLPWSQPQLGARLAEACQAQGYRVGWGMPGYDVDRVEDLQRLQADLAADPRPARRRLRHLVREVLKGYPLEPVSDTAPAAVSTCAR